MAPGTVNFSTLSTAAQTYEATCTTVPDFLATNLVKGINVLAAELHHAANDNTDPDIVMGAALDIAVASERPSLQITRPVSPPNSVRVSWAPGQCYTLEAATGLSGPWATITNASPYTVPRTNNFRFFRVKSKPMP
jgi:hypothetical protein